MSRYSLSIDKPRLSVGAQTAAAAAAVASSVLLPQVFHGIGIISGTGAALGAAFLPMYLPLMLAGLLAGPFVGLAAGALAPVLSFLISGMPAPAVLPMIIAETAACGLFAGLMRGVKLPALLRVAAVIVIAKLCRAVMTLGLIYVAGSQTATVSSIWESALQGLPGILLQLCVVPLAVFYAENRKSRHE